MIWADKKLGKIKGQHLIPHLTVTTAFPAPRVFWPKKLSS